MASPAVPSFQFVADNGLEVSAPFTISVNVSAAALVSLDFQSREPRIAVGGAQQITAVGDFADQQGVVLDPSYVTFQSTTTSVAAVSSLGRLVGLAQGTSILIVSAHGLQAETAVSVGVPTDTLGSTLYSQGLNPYPLAVALNSAGGTRQFDVNPVGDVDQTTDLSTAASGTHYFVGNAGIVTITPNGLMTAVGVGTTTVTIINGPAEAVIPVICASATNRNGDGRRQGRRGRRKQRLDRRRSAGRFDSWRDAGDHHSGDTGRPAASLARRHELRSGFQS